MTHPMCDGWTGLSKASCALANVALGTCTCMDSKVEVVAFQESCCCTQPPACTAATMLYAAHMSGCSYGVAIGVACTHLKAPVVSEEATSGAAASAQHPVHTTTDRPSFTDVNDLHPFVATAS